MKPLGHAAIVGMETVFPATGDTPALRRNTRANADTITDTPAARNPEAPYRPGQTGGPDMRWHR